MNEEALRIALCLIAATLPFVITLIAALHPRSKPRDLSADSFLNDYFLFGQKLSPHLFLKTSVGYSLQVAAIYLFLLWTFSYGVTAFFVPIAWGLGYIAVWIAFHYGWLTDFLKVKSSTDNASQRPEVMTIHGYVAEAATRGRRVLVLVMAFATLAGVGGTLIAEIDYTSSFLLSSLDISTSATNPTYAYLPNVLHIMVLLFAGFYVLWGGYRAVVITDTIQVPLAYVSFGGVLVAICGLAIGTEHSSTAGMAAALSAALFLGFLLIRRFIIRHTSLLDIFVFSGLFIVAFAVAASAFAAAPHLELSPNIVWPEHDAFWGFGLIGVLSLAVANSAWQFVDISSMQRLKSISFSQSRSGRRRVRNGLFATALESMGVWILAMMLAIALKANGVGSYEEVAPYLANLHGFALLILPLLVFAFVVFMISTVDGFISAASFVAFYDVVPRSSAVGNSSVGLHAQMSAPRWTTFGVLFIVYAAYLIVKWRVEQSGAGRIDQLLYAVYAVQLALLPVVVARLLWRRVNVGAGIASIAVGAFAAIYSAAIRTTPFPGMSVDSWYVFPPLATLGASAVTYVCVLRSIKLFQLALRRVNS